MAPGRYILRFRSAGPPPAGHAARIGAAAGVTVVDRSSPRMLLVEGSEAAVQRLAGTLPGWSLMPEVQVSLPEPPPPRPTRKPRPAGKGRGKG
jgi:hypothetical protein